MTHSSFFNPEIIVKGEQKEKFVLIPFSAAPYNKPIRSKKKWFVRIDYRWVNLTSGQFSIDSPFDLDRLVAVKEKDVSKLNKQHIVSEKK